MLDSVKNILKDDIRLHNRITSVKISLSREEKEFRRFVREISAVDPITDINGFRKVIAPALQREKIFDSVSYCAEAFHYGYYDELLHYAGMEREEFPLITSPEHGVRFASPLWVYHPFSICYSCQGRNRVNEIHDIDPWKPVFALGPYIHYSRDHYGAEHFARLKKQLGKVLLVFPGHTCEADPERSYEYDLVGTVMKKYAPQFDTVIVCMYWKNINDPIAAKFEANGARTVSAGFRGDRRFIRRLKTIIRLADTAVVDEIGTNIGFIEYMGKPVYFEGAPMPELDDALYIENFKRFRRAFSSKDMSFAEEQKEAQQQLYDTFWGGKECLLSKKQAALLFRTVETVCRKAGYRISRMPQAEKALLRSGDISDEMKHLLRSSLGADIGRCGGR